MNKGRFAELDAVAKERFGSSRGVVRTEAPEPIEDDIPQIQAPDDDFAGIERDMIKGHMGTFSQNERGLFLQQIPTNELYAELGRRIKRSESFADSLQKFVAEYRNS